MKYSLPLAAAVAALSCACSRSAPPDAADALPPAAVRVAPVESRSVAQAVEASGTVRPARSAQIAAKVMGVIEEMPVALGQRVAKGDVLVRLRADEIAARSAQAAAGLDSARRDLARETELLAKGASTAEMVRGLQDRFAAAQAGQREADAMVACTVLRAPFDGTVCGKFSDVGNLASPGIPVLALEDASGFVVDAPLPDSIASRLAPGAVLRVAVPSRGLSFEAALTELSPAADAGAHTVLAKLAVPPGIPVRSGEFARVEADGESAPALFVPGSAVTEVGQMQTVFVDGPGGRAVLRLVKTGALREGRVEVLSGLDEGEKVVVAPPAGLREGRALEVLP